MIWSQISDIDSFRLNGDSWCIGLWRFIILNGRVGISVSWLLMELRSLLESRKCMGMEEGEGG